MTRKAGFLSRNVTKIFFARKDQLWDMLLMKPIQRGIVIVCAMGILLCGLFPPWLYVFQPENSGSVEKNAGYHFIFVAPPPQGGITARRDGVQLHMKRLAVEWVCVVAVGVSVWALTYTKKASFDA